MLELENKQEENERGIGNGCKRMMRKGGSVLCASGGVGAGDVEEGSLSVFFCGVKWRDFRILRGFAKGIFYLFLICLGSLCNARENRELLPYVFKITKKKKMPNFL